MFEWIFSIDAWITLATLSALEIVLGIDNIIFLAILVSKLPPEHRDKGRILGLAFAMITRILLLLSLFWVMKLVTPLFSVLGNEISGRDLVLLLGGLFLIVKSIKEIKEQISHQEESQSHFKASNKLWIVVAEIAVIDIVFSLDSVITAVGIAQDVTIMIIAVIIAVAVMLFASKPIADFVEKYPSIKILALAFLVLIGVVLVAESFDIHIDKAYIYTAMAFALVVQILNILDQRKKKMAKDANGIELNTGDSVSVIKDLKVKGASTTLKRGTTIKNIKLTSKEGEIEARVDKFGVIVLKTEFLKKI
ncbi:TerC family protein [Campylobacter jejuni]|uniref:TerC family protein n=7 Tax=Campylobacterales TaxID=213849 RepID=A0A5Y9E017_CAMJU|nr:PhnA domain-containing protein [Campylobacter jejuni]EFV09309.1 phnA family protein [Campylobacter jejuni subsp. jejuni 305]AWB39793.1 membrane protein, TerC family [Campylobacter jejuni]EAJ4065116.1 TerC family protein [Campylobacter jejuni]EAK7653069.1 TerC family protein [Campylobacter jejuni]EAK7702915.1 TerC family protein [Campylobacter jejuni]